MDDLLDGFNKGRDAGIQHNHGNDHGAQVFDPPVAEGMLLVRFPAGQLCPDDRDQGTARVGDIVYRVKHNGDGVRHQANDRFERGQEYVGDDADYAGPDDGFFAGDCVRSFIPRIRVLHRFSHVRVLLRKGPALCF